MAVNTLQSDRFGLSSAEGVAVVLNEVGSSSQRTTSTAAQYGCKLKDYLQVKVVELIELLVRQYP
jgi:hypothetical protein